MHLAELNCAICKYGLIHVYYHFNMTIGLQHDHVMFIVKVTCHLYKSKTALDWQFVWSFGTEYIW